MPCDALKVQCSVLPFMEPKYCGATFAWQKQLLLQNRWKRGVLTRQKLAWPLWSLMLQVPATVQLATSWKGPVIALDRCSTTNLRRGRNNLVRNIVLPQSWSNALDSCQQRLWVLGEVVWAATMTLLQMIHQKLVGNMIYCHSFGRRRRQCGLHCLSLYPSCIDKRMTLITVRRFSCLRYNGLARLGKCSSFVITLARHSYEETCELDSQLKRQSVQDACQRHIG